MFVRGRFSAPGWYHAGRESFRLVDRRSAFRLVLYFFAIFNILIISVPSLVALGPLVGGSQVWRNELTVANTDVPGGAVAFIRISVTVAHAGREGDRSRYAFSQVTSIASFLAFMLSRLRPPSLRGR